MRWSKGIVYAALALFVALPVTVSAQFQMPQDTGLPTSPISSIIGRTMDWLLAMVGVIAIIAFVVSGIQYLTAAGDEGQAETAKKTMKFAIIGVFVALSAYAIVQAIDCALGANTVNAGPISISLWSC